jgi:hypothetical protein
MLIAIELAVALAVIIYAGFHDLRDVLAGTPPALAGDVVVACRPVEANVICEARTLQLNPGRFRVWTTAPAERLEVVVTPAAGRAHALLVQVAQPESVQMTIGSHPAVDLSAGGRTIVPVASGEPLTVSVAARAHVPAPIVLDELGAYEDARGLLSDGRPFFASVPPVRYHATLVQRAVASLCLFTVVAVLFLPPAPLRRWAPLTLSILCFSLCVLDLAVLFSPYFGHDLRSTYASGALQERPGSNLNGGLYQASQLLAGRGLTTRDGVVPWERMPGYGVFCALAAVLFGHATLVDLAVSTVLLQTIVYSAAVGVFVWAAGRVFTPAAAWTVGLVVAWLPKQLGYTQADALIAPIALLILAALCLRLERMRSGQPVPLAVDVAVHASFALWFVMRPDVLPAWLVMSLVLHWRDWRRLLVPLALFLAIGAGWGAYKERYTGEFTLTTTSVGASLFCGLFEAPSRFRFAQTCTDDAYFGWIHQNTPFEPQSAAANSFATREVLKFWLTYPGHVVVMAGDKLMQVLNGDLWPGYVTQLQVFVFQVVPRYWIVLSLLTVIAVGVAVGYERRRTWLMAWPLVLNAPLFFVLFASLGRFYSAAGVALIVASVPQLFEPQFYRTAAARPWRTATVVAGAIAFAAAAWPLHGWLLRSDGFHYWTPFIDPAASRLAVFK